MDEIEKILWIEGLKNAIQFNGKANAKAVMGKLMRDRVDLRSKANDFKVIIETIITQINALSMDAQREQLLKMDPHALDEKEKQGPEEKVLPDLENAEKGKVVMRLAPYPSGALHIGNARMVILNDEYVKRYNGKLLLVYDDTIGTSLAGIEDEDAKYVIPEAYDLIKEGLEWLGVKYHATYYKSDRVEIYQKEAGKMIAQGHAYVCTCDAQFFRDNYKIKGIECPCRSRSIEYHMDMYEKMKSGSIEEGKAVVRLKTGMDRKDPALRDHIIMRISDAPHPRIGTKVRLWPVLEWSWGIDDPMLGITHIIRGIDLDKEGQIEEIIWDLYGWNHANITLYGRLKFEDEFKLSKTLARRNIQLGTYDGWNDPRTWSLQSLAARGIHPNALRESLCDLGLSKRGIEFDKAWLYAKNTKLIDSSADRYWFVEKPQLLKVKGIPMTQFVAHPLFHPNFPDRGTRHIKVPISRGTCSVCISESDLHEVLSPKGKLIHPALSEGQVVRLKDMFNVKIEKLGDPIQATFDSLEMVQDSRKIQVVPKTTSIPLRVLQPDGITTEGFGETTLSTLKPGTIVQFERYGYVRLITISDQQIYGYFTNN